MTDAVELLRKELASKWAVFALRSEEDRSRGNDWFSKQLSLMFETDQRYRDLFVKLLEGGDSESVERCKERIRVADKDHQCLLMSWLKNNPWPSIDTFGSASCEHAWMIALHADNDIEFQREALAAISTLQDEGSTNPVHFAALHDRIAIGEGRLQRYGMFYTIVEGKKRWYPTEEPEKLSQRRASLGLGDTSFRR